MDGHSFSGLKPDTTPRCSKIWDDPNLCTRLVKLYDAAAQYTFRQIADILSEEFARPISRSAIAGRINRQEFEPRRTMLRPCEPRRYHKPRARPIKPVLVAVAPVAAPYVEEIPDPVRGVPLLELRAGQCKYAVDNISPFTFCAADIAYDSPYCAKHYARVHEAARKM